MKSPKNMSFPLPGILALAVLPLILSACVSTRTKLAAANTVTELQTQIEKQEETQQQAVESLVKQGLELHREGLRNLWAARKAEVSLEVYKRCDEKLSQLKQQFADEVNQALEPVEKRLNDAISAEVPKGAAGAEQANALRLQLASTLALVQQESSKNEMQLEQRMSDERTKLLQQVETEFKDPPAEIAGPVSDAQVGAVVAEYRKNSLEFRKNLKESTDSLREFVTIEEPWKLFLKGLIGDSLFGLIEPKLTQTIDATRTKVESKLDQIAGSLLKNLESRIGSITTKG